MRKGTTPNLVFEVDNKDIDLSIFKQIWLTLECGDYEQTWDMERLSVDNTKKTISIRFTQEETLKFPVGKVLVQLRFLDDAGRAFATKIIKAEVNRILNEGVITE